MWSRGSARVWCAAGLLLQRLAEVQLQWQGPRRTFSAFSRSRRAHRAARIEFLRCFGCADQGRDFWEQVPPSYTTRYRSLLTTNPHSTDVAIEGAGAALSKIDGNGWIWWSRFESLGLAAGRPHLVEPLFVVRFRIEGVHLQDSPFWTLHPYACDDVVVRGLRITADPVRGHNTDGIDPVSLSLSLSLSPSLSLSLSVSCFLFLDVFASTPH